MILEHLLLFYGMGFFLTILGLYGLIKDVSKMKKIGIVNLGPFGGQYPIFKKDNPKEFKIWLTFMIVIYFILLFFGIFFLIFPFIF